MKLKSIIIATISIMTMFSCSMENDTIMNDLDKTLGTTTDTKDVSAVVTASVSFSSLSTKANGTDDVTDQEIKNAVVFLLNGENVESVKSISSSGEATPSFYTKSGTGKSLYAVANLTETTLNTLIDCKTLTEIKAVPLSAEDLALAPKASGTAMEIDFSGFEAKKEGDQTIYNAEPIVITVAQRTARVELAAVNYSYKEGMVEYPNVKLTGVSFRNQNTSGQIEGLIDGSFAEDIVWGSTISKKKDENAFDVSGIYFRTYANNSETNKTALVLQFDIEGRISTVTIPEKVYTIKTPEKGETIEANHIYRLTINAIVSSGDIEISVQGTVEDWQKNTVELDPIWGEEDNK